MIKLYLDEDVHKKVAAALRIRGYDVISSHEIGNWGISDFQQLEYVISQSTENTMSDKQMNKIRQLSQRLKFTAHAKNEMLYEELGEISEKEINDALFLQPSGATGRPR